MPYQNSDFHELKGFLKYLTNDLKMDIVISDFIGFSSECPSLLAVLEPYTVHRNPFCMHVKGNTVLWKQCVKNKRLIARKILQTNEPFFGVCHCGVGEYIFPIGFKNSIAGFISVCGYQAKKAVQAKRIQYLCRRYGFEDAPLQYIYHQSLTKRPEEDPFVQTLAGMLAFTLTSIANQSHLNPELTDFSTQWPRRLVVLQAIEFIKVNYEHDVGVEDIARFCNCSKSHMQHLFKRYHGMGVMRYLENVRMQQAKKLLEDTDLPVCNIALQVGFHDPNYFSATFSKLCGSSPSVHRSVHGTPGSVQPTSLQQVKCK